MVKIKLSDIKVGDIIHTDSMKPGCKHISVVVETGGKATKLVGYKKLGKGEVVFVERPRQCIKLKNIAYFNGEKWITCEKCEYGYAPIDIGWDMILFAGDRVDVVVHKKTRPLKMRKIPYV